MVHIVNPKLGGLFRLLQACIVLYVLVYQVLYKCNHLKEAPVTGFLQMNVLPPQNAVNISNITYCQPNASVIAEPPCTHVDAVWESNSKAPSVSSIFVPTFVMRLQQHLKRGCETWADLVKDDCEHSWLPKANTSSEAADAYYVAGAEEVGLQISVAARVIEQTGVLILPEVFHYSLGEVLQLAMPGPSPLDKDGAVGAALRRYGVAIEFQVDYSNYRVWRPLGTPQMKSTRSAMILNTPFYRNNFAEVAINGSRVVHWQNGVVVHGTVSGSYYYFSGMALLQVISASVGLLAIASLITDGVMTRFCGHLSKHYQILKYQPSAISDESAGASSGEAGYVSLSIMEPMLRKQCSSKKALEGEALYDMIYDMHTRLNRLDGLALDKPTPNSAPVQDEGVPPNTKDMNASSSSSSSSCE